MAGDAPRQRKDLGQHFLREPRIVRRIIEAADIQLGERVLEIGPGGGVMTSPLCEAVGSDGEVVAVEADQRFAARLEADAPANLHVVRGDALQAGLAGLGPFNVVVSNLPYQISGPITATLLRMLDQGGWDRAVLMYQKEFAERLLAGPGTKKYGRLSVQTARRCSVVKVRDVPPGCFEPPPKVHSTVLRLDPHPTPPFRVVDETLWDAAIDGAFGQRRKQLRNSIPAALEVFDVPREKTLEALTAMAFDRLRPEQVSPADFAAIVARVRGT